MQVIMSVSPQLENVKISGHRRLKSGKRQRFPREIAFITIDKAGLYFADQTENEARPVKIGRIAYCTYANGKRLDCLSSEITTADDVWLTLERLGNKRNRMLVVLDGASRCCHKLGLFSALDSGTVSLDVPHNAKISKSTGKPSYDMGLYQFVFSDAVAVITCKLQNEKRIKIVGWHNYFKRPSKYDGGTSERLSEMVEQFDSLIETASTLGCLDWRTTISGIAHSVYRANMPDIPIYSHNSPDTKQLERQAFFGGRVSAFGTGRISEQVHYIDCVSMYPAIMGSTPLPSRILSHFRNLDCSPDRIKGNPESMIARCLISSNSTEYPTREKDSLEYSIGELETVLCGPEFKHAIDSGHVIKVMEIAEYKLDVLFADFVDKCWNALLGS
jgi:hypothetical protein